MTTIANRERAEGIAANLAADTAAHRGYSDLVRDVIDSIPPGEPFTADTVRAAIPSSIEPHSPNVLPSVFGQYAAAGVIRRVGETNAARRSRHGSRNAVWVRT